MKKLVCAFALLLSGAMLLSGLAGCGTRTPSGTETSATSGTASETEAPATSDTVSETETEDPDRDWEPVKTKFGTFRFPDQWFDFLETEQSETEDAVTVLFRAVIGDRKIDLYELTVGAGEGEAAGTLTGPDGIGRGVYVRLLELPDLSGLGLSEGETDRVYAMQESLNSVIDSLS